MKTSGIFFTALGLIWIVVALNMETTVASGFGEVHNIGLIEQRRIHLVLAGLATLMGVILIGFSSVSSRPGADSSSQSKICPHCAEQIKRDASVCRFCGRDVPPLKHIKRKKELRDIDRRLINAVQNGDFEECKKLLSQGADPDARKVGG